MKPARFHSVLGILVLGFVWLWQHNAFAQVPLDSTNVALRLPADGALNAYRDDPDFIYERPAEPGYLSRQYMRLKQWLIKQLESLFPRRVVNVTFKLFPYLLVIATALIAIRILMKTKLSGLISREDRQTALHFQQLGPTLDEIDFDSHIRQALETQDWKTAVRYSYLRTLKKLSDHDLIHWTRDKTNHEYVAEITHASLHIPFGHLTHLFEFIYYGDFSISQAGFEHAATEFRQFETLLAEVR